MTPALAYRLFVVFFSSLLFSCIFFLHYHSNKIFKIRWKFEIMWIKNCWNDGNTCNSNNKNNNNSNEIMWFVLWCIHFENCYFLFDLIKSAFNTLRAWAMYSYMVETIDHKTVIWCAKINQQDCILSCDKLCTHTDTHTHSYSTDLYSLFDSASVSFTSLTISLSVGSIETGFFSVIRKPETKRGRFNGISTAHLPIFTTIKWSFSIQ